MTSDLLFNKTLNRKIRQGGWQELAEGTPRLIRQAIVNDENDRSVELVDFLVLEFRVIFDIYSQWIPDTKKFILSQGILEDEFLSLDKEIKDKLTPYHRFINQDRELTWQEVEKAADDCKNLSLSKAKRLGEVERIVGTWRRLHDGDVDRISGLFHFIQTRFGEKAIETMYEEAVIGDWFAKRYKRFDVSNIAWEEASWLLTYLGFEGHHGHLSGSFRDGTIDWEEDEEKVTLSFAPCGSGGRSMEGESRNQMPPLSDRRFGWNEMKEAHDFTWNKKGICAYCAHCCVIHETLPIKEFGYPVRVTHPPQAPLTGESRCSWVIYKDLRKIPEEIYTRVGAVKPTVDMPLGSKGKSQRKIIE